MKRNAILKEIDEPDLQLYQAPGYFYFVYDDGAEIYDQHSVYVDKLSHMHLEQWVEEGKEFVKKVKEEYGC